MAISSDICTLDFETRSAVELKRTGTYVYAADKSTDAWCMAYAFGEEGVGLWSRGQPFPERLADHIADGKILVAHNAAFERVIWNLLCTPRYGWPQPKLSQWRCTMAMAYAMALPGSLDGVASVLRLDVQKDKAGHRLMMQMARPRKRHENGHLEWWDVDEKKQRLYDYCKTDVLVEREVFRRLVPLSDIEQAVWRLDQEINDRGVMVDKDLCDAAKKIVQQQKAKLDREIVKVTGGLVSSTTAVAELTRWINDQGVKTDSIAKAALAEILDRANLPANVERALEIRQEAGKASVAKIDALLAGRSSEGRAQGLLQYHAASTGRWAGRRFQPQNLKRPDEETNIDEAIADMLAGATANHIELLHGPPLSIVGDCIRGMVKAAPGKKLYVGDFVSIEAVVLAWMAGESWKLQAFRDYRAGKSPDLYIQSYCKAFGVPLFPKKDPRRQTGKVMELASGYEGGHGAYLKMGAKGKKLDELTVLVKSSASPDEWGEAYKKFSANNPHHLTRDQWTALRITIDRWRAAHPAIKQFWKDLDYAALCAVKNPGQTVTISGKNRPSLKFKMAGSFLWLQLPSGRVLCYPFAHIEKGVTPWGEEREFVVYAGDYSQTWLYGGLLAENVVQAAARDFLRDAMMRLDDVGYEVIMHVHDEAVTEVDQDFGSLKEFEAIMSVLPEWGTGCPIAVDAWEGKRYRK